MHPSELFDALKKQTGIASDAEIATLLDLTPGRVSQMRAKNHNLTARQIVSYLKKARSLGTKEAYVNPIKPIVEMYPISSTASRNDKKREILPTGKNNLRNKEIRKCLEAAKGIYIFYDSLGCAIYAGKTEKQNLWKEMTSAFNRHRTHHQTFIIKHPTTGDTFIPAWKSPRQPISRIAFLYNTASFFSAYQVAAELIPTLEAMLVRSFCNTLSNKKMEKF